MVCCGSSPPELAAGLTRIHTFADVLVSIQFLFQDHYTKTRVFFRPINNSVS